MTRVYHVLNGDALKGQIANVLSGEVITMRECLVDGPVAGVNLEDLYRTRVKFIDNYYTPTKWEDYHHKVVVEFLKIQNIPNDAEVNLWFEDDLFCQVNMWFVLHLLAQTKAQIFLVRPLVHTRYGFGGLSTEELLMRLEQRIELSDLHKLTKLWSHYQSGDLTKLKTNADKLKYLYPFLSDAVDAHIARLPDDITPGLPVEILMEIIDEMGAADFGQVYEAFAQRASIYGFGDIQVRRLMDGIDSDQ